MLDSEAISQKGKTKMSDGQGCENKSLNDYVVHLIASLVIPGSQNCIPLLTEELTEENEARGK